MFRNVMLGVGLSLSFATLAIANDAPVVSGAGDEIAVTESHADFRPVRRIVHGTARVAGGVVYGAGRVVGHVAHGTAHVVGGVVYGAGHVVGGVVHGAAHVAHGAAGVVTWPLRRHHYHGGYYHYSYPAAGHPEYVTIPAHAGGWRCFGYPQGVEGAIANEAFSSDYGAAYQVALNTCTESGHANCAVSCQQH